MVRPICSVFFVFFAFDLIPFKPLAGAEKVVKIWSPETGEFLRNLTGHTQGLSDIAWSSDSVYLASASDDTTIRIWKVETVGPRLSLFPFKNAEKTVPP